MPVSEEQVAQVRWQFRALSWLGAAHKILKPDALILRSTQTTQSSHEEAEGDPV